MPDDRRGYRVPTIDLLRGVVIALMAIDHVRDFVMVGGIQDPTLAPDASLATFFTRWITHVCAPVFVCLAGVSVGLMARRRAASTLSAFLVTRGLWLVGVEWTVVSLAWSFAPGGIAELGGQTLIALGVIWAIGVSMLVLAALHHLGRRLCLALGVAIVAGHNLLDPVWPATTGMFDTTQPLWVGLHAQVSWIVGPLLVVNVYPLLPWVGVMLLGFGVSGVFEASPAPRDRRLVTWGVAATVAFVLVRGLGVYGDPDRWQWHATSSATLVDMLNVSKYPPSLLYVLMTLGPAAILCGLASRLPERVARPLVTLGRAPFAFYVAHLYLIHVIAIVLGTLQGFAPSHFLTFFAFFPKGYGVGLAGVYGIWLLVVAALYPLCAWVASVKADRRDWWLSYL